MFDWLFDPRFLLFVAIIAIGQVIIGRWSREPAHLLALSVVGWVLGFAGLAWSASISLEALLATGVGGGGAIVMTQATERTARRRAEARNETRRAMTHTPD